MYTVVSQRELLFLDIFLVFPSSLVGESTSNQALNIKQLQSL